MRLFIYTWFIQYLSAGYYVLSVFTCIEDIFRET